MHIPHATHTAYTTGFYADASRDYAVRIMLGRCASGAADAGEIFAAISDVPQGHPRDWFDTWVATGRRLATAAGESAVAGHRASAASKYLRASTYLAEAFDALDGIGDDAQRQTVFTEHRDAWERFVDHGRFETTRLRIPCDGIELPGWFLRPAAGSGKTLVLVNGSDGSISGMWGNGAFGALARGYNVVLFDGPGQQSMLFEQHVGFRPDWENVLTPVLDVVLAQPGVDAGRTAVYGVSQGGYWVPRALAFEHRFAAAIVDPGVVEVQTSWLSNIPARLRTMLDEGRDADFDKNMSIGMRFSPETKKLWDFRARPYGKDSYAATMRAVAQYTLTPELGAQITTPMFITDPEHEQFWPGQSEQLAILIGDHATVAHFTAEQGASWHCQPMARTLTDECMFDWLDEQLDGPKARS